MPRRAWARRVPASLNAADCVAAYRVSKIPHFRDIRCVPQPLSAVKNTQASVVRHDSPSKVCRRSGPTVTVSFDFPAGNVEKVVGGKGV